MKNIVVDRSGKGDQLVGEREREENWKKKEEEGKYI